MKSFLERFDEMAVPSGGGFAQWLDRIVFAFLVLMVLAAPHSIAATQIAWLTGMFVWFIRIILRPRINFKFGWLDAALWGLFAWSLISGILSYDPPISLDRLRVVALFLIFYFVFYNVKNLRAAYLLGFALIVSCMVNVAWTPVQKWMGRGVEIHGVDVNGPLGKAGLTDGDTLDRANGKRLNTADAAATQLSKVDVTTLEFYRGDFETDAKVSRSDLAAAETPEAILGISGWTTGRILRPSGFYRHYVTYAESLQLIGSLACGLFISAFLFSGRRDRNDPRIFRPRGRSSAWIWLVVFPGCIGAVLLMTATRASQLGLAVSAFSMLIAVRNKRLLVIAALLAIPLAIGAGIYLKQVRNIGYVDAQDESTQYREVMWRDGFRLWTASPHNLIFGIGMDSIKSHWREWGMFDGGRLPVSHFHSTPVQIVVERGLPALLLWLAVLGVYLRALWPAIRKNTGYDLSDWRSTGLLLGCFGGSIGFFTSGLVHYNLGDSVVAMLFFLLMGLGMRIAELTISGSSGNLMSPELSV